MKKRVKVAQVLFYLVGGLCVIMAGLYLTTPTILPYHAEYLGKTHDKLDPKYAALFLYAIKIIGAMSLSIAIGIFVLARKVASGENWVRWTLLVMPASTLGVVLWVNLSVGPTSPWYVIVVMIVLLISGFFLSRE